MNLNHQINLIHLSKSIKPLILLYLYFFLEEILFIKLLNLDVSGYKWLNFPSRFYIELKLKGKIELIIY